MPPELRVGIAGTGFIGGVHARSARLAGARVVAVAASSPESADGGRGRARRRARGRLGRRAGAGPGGRRRPHLHAEPPPPAAGGGRARRRQARGLREAARARRGRGRAARGRGRRVEPPGRGAVRLPLLPDRARGARARARRGDGRRAPAARDLPPGLAAAPRGRQLARRREPRRRVAGLRRHRLALVRPRGVRLGPPAHAALGAHPDRGARAGQRRRDGRRSPPGTAPGSLRDGDHRGRRDRPVRDRRPARSARS